MASSIFEKLTTHSRNALKNAFSFAQSANHRSVTPKHVLYGLSAQKGSIASHILHKAGIEESSVREELQRDNGLSATPHVTGLNAVTRRILEKSFLVASTNGHRYVGTEHLLAALLSLRDETLEQFFSERLTSAEEIKRQVDMIMGSTSRFPDFNNYGFFPENGAPAGQQTAERQSMLEQFAINLTDENVQKNIDPVIGRQSEIDRLIQILSRRNKNNPLLLGDPGVGKTAIVEGLAKRILEGGVPYVLRDKKIYSLDLSSVIAGTSFRGEFENRMKMLMTEVRQNPSIILFIDEIHNIIGVGSATGSMDAANILKPALARGEIRCIGATTLEEYKKHIESDPALERRFQPISVDQPSVEETISILEGIRHNYERFHGITINASAITAAAYLADRYITDRFLPDKAIDLIDEAASALKISRGVEERNTDVYGVEQQLRELTRRKNEAVGNEKYRAALRLRDQEHRLNERLEALKGNSTQKTKKQLPELTEHDIARIIGAMTGIPTHDIVLEERNYLLKLEKELAKHVIGQDHAVSAVAEFIRRSRTGITDRNRPIGSFMFLGPSGVGKTELARVLAEKVFGSASALVKIDMSEFAESFNISKLIGAPAGYIGYKEGTKLTDAVKRRPYSVVLFDEIEKAHRQIFHLLLQVLEDGYLTDATGKKIDFRNTIIIMTSNAGSNEFTRRAALGFADKSSAALTTIFPEIESAVYKHVEDKFPQEFINRIDRLVVFKPLTAEALGKIASIQLNELTERLKKQGITLTFNEQTIQHVANKGYSAAHGARGIRKHIQENVESVIARKILSGKKQRSRRLALSVKNDSLTV